MPPPVMAGPLIPTSHPTFLGMQQEEIDRIVGEVMRFILFNHNNKTPTKLEMINRHVMKKRCPGGIKLILADARRRFKELYGYELVEIPLHLVQSASKAQKEHAKRKLAKANTSYRKEKDKEQESKRKKKATAKTTSKLYILKNSSDEQDDMRTMNELSDFNKFDVAIRGLLFSIFGLIYIKGGAIEEAVLWKYLERWGLSQKMKNHEVSGMRELSMSGLLCGMKGGGGG